MNAIDHLLNIGLDKNEATVLAELIDRHESTTPELEARLKLERRSVGKALYGLERLGAVTSRLDSPDGKGRPATIWSIDGLSEWLDRRETEEKEKMGNNKEKIEKLRGYWR